MDLDGKRVLIMGLGRFGGGLGVTRFCARRGANCLVTDLATQDQLTGALEDLQDLIRDGTVELRLGGHNVSDFTTCDLVIANPAVPEPWNNRFLRAANAAGIPVTTEIALLVRSLPNRNNTVGITGTAGKSTTTAMLAEALRSTGRTVHVGGNLGGSLLNTTISPSDPVLLELSSAQLHWIRESTPDTEGNHWTPAHAVVTSFAPNHLDWHGSMNHYESCKRSMLPARAATDTLTVPHELTHWHRGTGRALSTPETDNLPVAVIGEHNQHNARLALAAARAILHNADTPTIEHARDAIADFPGLPHRLSLVHQHAGVRWYNDSKCTTPKGAELALRALRPHTQGVIHLIVGGHDKHIDLSPVLAAAHQSSAHIYAIGQTAQAILRLADTHAVRAHHSQTLERAVEQIRSALRPGDAVLLSPACASWDQFVHFEQRGDRFTQLAKGPAP